MSNNSIKSSEFGSSKWVNNKLKKFSKDFDEGIFDEDNFTPFPSIYYTMYAIMATADNLDMLGHIRYLQIVKDEIEKELESIFGREG